MVSIRRMELTEELSDQKIEAMVEDGVVAGDETTGKPRANGGRGVADSKISSLTRRLFGRD